MDHDAVTTEVIKRPVGRPSNITRLVPERVPMDRAKVINSYHSLSRQAAQDAVSYAVMAGMELAAAKAALPHGSFMNWVEKHCEFTLITAQRYMLLADRMLESGAMKAVIKDLPAGQVQSAGDRKALLVAIRETTDGNTLQQLYFDFGILKPKDGPVQKGGARVGAGRPATSENFTEARKAAMRQDYAEVFRSLTDMIVVKKTWQYLDAKDLAEMDDRLKMYRETIKPALSAATTR